MKTNQFPKRKAAALITTLILVSAVALVTVSFLTISRNEAQISGNRISNVRADLAERAAFEEAKNLLTSLTGNDHYLVSSQIEPSGNSDTVGTRYTFITTPKPDGVEHVPLFAGGKSQSTSLANLDEAETASLIDSPPGQPEVEIDSAEKTESLELFGLTHLTENGGMKPENRFPETGLIDLPEIPGDRFRYRYSWWAEDLEGFPNIDVIGGWTDHFGTGGGTSLDMIRPGYSSHDSRTAPPALPVAEPKGPGLRIPIAENSRFAWQFPKSFRGQKVVDQVAPGLSPREISLMPWATSEIAIEEHPFSRVADLASARHWLSSGGAYTRTSALKREHRFMVGLSDYVRVPRIPFNHDYADEGLPRHNLNRLVADRAVSSNQGQGGFVEIVARNLENFEESRKGGFPDDEDYLATIAANTIDYADEDSLATGPGSSTNDGNHSFRGVDSYCPVNELFIKFTYDGFFEDNTFRFSAEIFAEFWNATNRVAEMEQVSLELEFLHDLGFDYNGAFGGRGGREKFDLSQITLNEPKIPSAQTIKIEPNQFYLHNFGKIEWTIPADLSDLPDFGKPTIANIGRFSSARSATRTSYSLFGLNRNGERVLIDRCARPVNSASTDGHGFLFFSYDKGRINNGESFLRLYPGNDSVFVRGSGISGFNGSLLGDSWMTYYARGEFEEFRTRASTKNKRFTQRGTPGFPNFNHHKVFNENREDLIRDQTRVRFWPDGGYDNRIAPVGLRPVSDVEFPENFDFENPNISSHVKSRAPRKISNQEHFYSVSELGNLHDPCQWSSLPLDEVNSGFLHTKFSHPAFYRNFPEHFKDVSDSPKHQGWGGGNTLRIGRPEHPLFDRPNMRASQLLDLFQVGMPGTNLASVTGNPDQLYNFYDPRDHQPPPAAPNENTAQEPPFNRVYDERLHAQGIFEKRHGHLNINSVPTLFEMEALLRGPFVSSDVIQVADDPVTPEYRSAAELGIPGNGLRPDAIPLVARDLYQSRPFYSPSHLARVLSDSIRRHDAYPEAYNDAEAEETFARVFNTTSFSSRHFRIFTYGEVLSDKSDVVLSRSRKIYEVFLEPEHDDAGEVTRVTTRILSIRDL